MTRVETRSLSAAHFEALVKFAYGFVLGHIDGVKALTHLLRGEHRRFAGTREEEQW